MTGDKFIITEEELRLIPTDCWAHTKRIRSRLLSEELKAERERVMDAHGILYGEDAKRFHEEMNNPNPVMTEVSKELIREAQKMVAFDEKHDAEIAKKERERVLQKVVKILAAHTINSDDFKQDNINDGWVLIGGYEPILEEIESLRGEP